MITFENKFVIGQQVIFQTAEDVKEGVYRTGKVAVISSTTTLIEGTMVSYSIWDRAGRKCCPILQENVFLSLHANGVNHGAALAG